MKRITTGAALLPLLAVSTLVVGCADRGDTAARAALERQALERDLDLALRPDPAAELELVDVALPEPEAPAAEAAPAPAPPPLARPAPPPQPRTQPRTERRVEPAPAPAPERPRYVTRTAPRGSTIAVRINQEVSTRGGAGQTFTATLSQPLLASDGSVLIPAGATVRGRVTSAQVSGNAGERADLQVAFTSITHGGQTYPISGTVVNAPPVRRVNRDSRAQTAAKVGGGAAVGAVVGRVIGRDTRSTVAGAAVGAAAGTAVAIGTADVDAVIDAGSSATIRLDAPVSVQVENR